MPMNKLLSFIIVVFISGCATNGPSLTPVQNKTDEYWMFYKRSAIEIPLDKGTSYLERLKAYEPQVNIILQNDPNTASCAVIKGSIIINSLGPDGTARVRCINSPPLEKDGLFNMDGTPNYRYRMSVIKSI